MTLGSGFGMTGDEPVSYVHFTSGNILGLLCDAGCYQARLKLVAKLRQSTPSDNFDTSQSEDG